MLGIAYAANIGGTATLVGTPPNLAFQKELLDSFGQDVTFLSWMAVGLPFALLMGVATWMMLVYRLFPVGRRPLFGGRNVLLEQLQALGRLSAAERRMLVIGLVTALLWVFRMPVEGWGWAVWLGIDLYVDDGTVAMAMALLCFFLPSGEGAEQRLLHWRSTARTPLGGPVLVWRRPGSSQRDGGHGGWTSISEISLPRPFATCLPRRPSSD